MANATLFLKPEGSRDQAAAFTPNRSGSYIDVPGSPGRAWQLSETATNLVTDPRVAVNTNAWLTHAVAVKSHLTSGVNLTINGVAITTAVRYDWNGVYSSG